MNLKRMWPLASPSTSPSVRVRCTRAPTVETGSFRSCTTEAPARTRMTRPTSPSGTITGASGATPSPRPRFTVSDRTQPPPSRPMTSLERVAMGSCWRSSSSRRSRPFSRCVSSTARASTRSRSLSARSRALSHRADFQSTYSVQTESAPRWSLTRRTCTGLKRRETSSPGAPSPVPRVCAVSSPRQTTTTVASNAYLRILTRDHPGDRRGPGATRCSEHRVRPGSRPSSADSVRPGPCRHPAQRTTAGRPPP